MALSQFDVIKSLGELLLGLKKNFLGECLLLNCDI